MLKERAEEEDKNRGGRMSDMRFAGGKEENVGDQVK